MEENNIVELLEGDRNLVENSTDSINEQELR
jgi:hypothetical protein